MPHLLVAGNDVSHCQVPGRRISSKLTVKTSCMLTKNVREGWWNGSAGKGIRARGGAHTHTHYCKQKVIKGRIWDSETLKLYLAGMVSNACKSSKEAEGSEVQGHPQIQRKVSLSWFLLLLFLRQSYVTKAGLWVPLYLRMTLNVWSLPDSGDLDL